MKREFKIIIILALIIVVLAAILFFWPVNKEKNNTQTFTKTEQKVEGIQVTFPKANEKISSPLKITGVVNNGGWSGFEGQVGIVQLLDAKGKEITKGVLKATTDWTKTPVQFESTLVFKTDYKGSATLLFSNENPSGLPANDKKFGLPIVIK